MSFTFDDPVVTYDSLTVTYEGLGEGVVVHEAEAVLVGVGYLAFDPEHVSGFRAEPARRVRWGSREGRLVPHEKFKDARARIR